MSSPADGIVLTLNAGSSSVRLAAFSLAGADDVPLAAVRHEATPDAAPALLAEFVGTLGGAVHAVSHRIVHGGPRLHAPCLVDAAVETEIARLAPLAPLHNPPALAWLAASRALSAATVPQIAVFDTGYYADLPAVARTYALPAALCERHGLRRYGFHGLAHRAMWRRWCALAPGVAGGGRVISIQLGAGCSMTAVDRGAAIDTTMGFTPLEGLVMATRSGDIDPGLLLYLQRELGVDPAALDHLLTHEAGLLGLSGTSGDMRELLRSGDPRARLAVDVYTYRARKYVGAFLAALGGADAILVGGGVGEHAPAIRAAILAPLGWAGIVLDDTANEAATAGDAPIAAPGSRVAVHVIAVDEARELADAARALLRMPRA